MRSKTIFLIPSSGEGESSFAPWNPCRRIGRIDLTSHVLYVCFDYIQDLVVRHVHGIFPLRFIGQVPSNLRFLLLNRGFTLTW